MRTSGKRLTPTQLVFGIAVVVLPFIAAYPFWWMLVSSFLPQGTSQATVTLLWPSAVSVEAYRAIFTEKPMLRWLTNTVLVTASATGIAVFVAVLASYAITRFNLKGKHLFVRLILLTQMIPPSSLIIPLFLVFRAYRLLDTLTAVSIAYTSFTVPFAIWLLWGYFQSIPQEFEEAAMVDGCSKFGAFLRVTLPLSLPGVAATALFAFEQGWNQYLLAYVLTSNEGNWVISLGLYSFIGQYIVYVEQMMAASVIATIPPVIVFVVLQRYLVGGLTLGGMKG